MVFEGPSETLLTSSAVGASPPYIMISAAQVRESDYLRHAMSPFSFFFSIVHVKNLGICEATKDRSGASSRNWRRSLWRIQTGTDFTLR